MEQVLLDKLCKNSGQSKAKQINYSLEMKISTFNGEKFSKHPKFKCLRFFIGDVRDESRLEMVEMLIM